MNFNTPINEPAWIIVLSAEQASIYEYISPKGDLLLRSNVTHTLPKRHELERDRQGRNKNQQMPGGESYTKATDAKDNEKDSFSKRIAQYLFDNIQNYERLVIVADPAILGMMRDNLHKEVRHRVVREIDKNMAQYDKHELAKHLNHVFQFDTPKSGRGFDDLQQRKKSKTVM